MCDGRSNSWTDSADAAAAVAAITARAGVGQHENNMKQIRIKKEKKTEK